MAIAIQFLIACALGSATFAALADDPNPKVPYIGGFIVGVAGQWVAVFLWVWVRYGWKAARSMTFG